MRICTKTRLRNMASAEREVCVDKEAFYKTVEEIKAKQKTKDSPITLFVDDKFYNRAKHFLKAKVEDEQALAEVREPTIEPLVLTAHETSTITRKKWKYANDNIVTEDGRKVIPKDQLHTVLCFAHQRVAHREQQITQKWIQDNYAEVNQKIVNVFRNMCKFHAEQKPVTSRVKPVTQPLSGETFGSLLELDLMDFRKCPCSLHSELHKWAANFIDRHTKFVHVVPLHRKSAEEVLGVFKTYCLTFGHPRKLITDNGKEFKNKEMNQFCDNWNKTVSWIKQNAYYARTGRAIKSNVKREFKISSYEHWQKSWSLVWKNSWILLHYEHIVSFNYKNQPVWSSFWL